MTHLAPIAPANFAGEMATRGGVFVVGVGVLSWLVFWQRKRLVPLFSTRPRRTLEALILFGLQALFTVLIACIDFQGIWKRGAILDAESSLVWSLEAVLALYIVAQLFAVLHTDVAEQEKKALHTERAALELERNDARYERDFTATLMNSFVRVVSRKRERLAAVINDEDAVKRALDPQAQLAALVSACWELFNGMVNSHPSSKHRVRVAYFVVVGRRLTPLHCWNGFSADCVPRWDATTKRLFELTNPEGCLAVAASRDGATFLVPDAAAAHEDPTHPFVFFEESERNDLKSIAALPIKIEGEGKPYDVLIVDTACEEFFNPADLRQKLQIEQIVFNLAHRLQLERRVLTLLGEN